ncbi:tRNA modification GTPase [Petrotoga sp. 9PWA.NaAc.5.4]|nr:tRNA modification GTPase [Petrotoga sp. 9PWA.NaAc.5.4]
MIYDTIAAISTPIGTGAIGSVRVSGNKVKKIIDNTLKPKNYESKRMYYGWLYDENKKIDEITWVYHKGPNSYTGEDMLEIFCHGGKLITLNVLKTILKNGARQALPGEFSKRAVLNGKMDLIKAEAINNLIKSETEIALKVSLNQLSNSLSKKIIEIKNELLKIAAEIEVEMDYPEDVELTTRNLNEKLKEILKNMENILQESDNGIIAIEGLKTVIVGKPNSGKSTLLNALLRKDRAIVTDIPGTTRDTIEENLNINGIFIRLIDTAGIRHTKDKLEKIGIERTISSMKQADLILFVVDGTTPFDDSDNLIYNYVKNLKDKNVIIVLNKNDSSDFNENNYFKNIQDENYEVISVSAKNCKIKSLEDKIFEMYFEKLNIEEPTLTTQRQKNALESAKEYVISAIDSINKGFTNDVVMIDIRKSIEKIYELTGENYTDELLNTIFSNFCVGK